MVFPLCGIISFNECKSIQMYEIIESKNFLDVVQFVSANKERGQWIQSTLVHQKDQVFFYWNTESKLWIVHIFDDSLNANF